MQDDHNSADKRGGARGCVPFVNEKAAQADRLPDIRTEFDEEFSIHIYSLEPSPLEVCERSLKEVSGS
jgi:hypothetical protein